MRGLTFEALADPEGPSVDTAGRGEPITSALTWLGCLTSVILLVIGLLIVVNIGGWLFNP